MWACAALRSTATTRGLRMTRSGPDEALPFDADASLDQLVQTLTAQAGRSLGLEAQACASATVRGLDRWLAAASVAVARCDGTQDRNRLGPRYTARSTGEHVLVPEVGAETRWPVWTHACRVQGFRSAAVVVGRHRDVTVYLGLYAPQPQDWAGVLPRAVGLAEGIASVAAVRDEVAALADAMDDLLDRTRSQVLIDQAVGVLMAREGCDAATAVEHLKAACGGGDPRAVAAGLVAQAGPEQASARNRGPTPAHRGLTPTG
jgi:hypothetical protein